MLCLRNNIKIFALKYTIRILCITVTVQIFVGHLAKFIKQSFTQPVKYLIKDHVLQTERKHTKMTQVELF